MKAVAPTTETQEEKPYHTGTAVVSSITFSGLFIVWLILQLHK